MNNNLGKRIMVIGCSGAGKSTLSNSLSEKLSLPIIHLDQEYWLPNWQETPKEIWEKKVSQLIEQKEWIMDGNFGGTQDMRMARADTVIFLYYSRWLCLFRAIRRINKYHGVSRPDMSPGCPERYDLSFFHFILFYNHTRAPTILKRLAGLGPEKNVFIFRKPAELEQWLKEI